MKKDLLKLSNIEVSAIHGYYDTEKIHQQKFIVNLTCEIDEPFGDSDELHKIVNYENLRTVVFQVFEQSPLNLIETLANQIAALVLNLPKVTAVTVNIKKPEVWKDALPEVEIYRHN